LTYIGVEEAAADDHIAAGFQRDGIDIIAIVRRRIKGGFTALGIVIMINQAGKLVVGRVHEAGVHGSVSIQTRNRPRGGSG
jgi:hypothetical protein